MNTAAQGHARPDLPALRGKARPGAWRAELHAERPAPRDRFLRELLPDLEIVLPFERLRGRGC